jgi:hypothetical protein
MLLLTKPVCRKYKGSKIEWDVDECAQPYPSVPALKARKSPPAPKKAATTMANRFQLLNMDDGDEEDDEIATAFQAKKPVGIAA